MADPATSEIPLDWLISPEYAAERSNEIVGRNGVAADFASGGPVGAAGESKSTTHLNVIDGNRTMVSATQTLNSYFGSRVTTPGCGMLLNSSMRLMNPPPGRTNSIAPSK